MSTSEILPPTSRMMYFTVPFTTGTLAGLGAGILSAGSAQSAGQVVAVTCGWFLMASSVGFTVALVVVQQERAKWWEYKTALVNREPIPQDEDEEEEPTPKLVMTPKGLGWYDRAHNTLRLVKITRRGPIMAERERQDAARKARVVSREAPFVNAFETVARIEVESKEEGEDQTSIIDINRGLWIMAQHGAADPNISTAEGDWSEHFGVKEFRMLRDGFIQTGFAEWKSPRARTDPKARKVGWRFTSKARAYMRGIVGLPTPPPPRKIPIVLDGL